MALHFASDARPLDTLFFSQHRLNESSINTLVQQCDSFSREEEKTVDDIVQSLLERHLFTPAAALVAKIINPFTKNTGIGKIHQAMVKVLKEKRTCNVESKLLQAMTPRSPDWRSYGALFNRLVTNRQFWAAKALVPLIANPELQERSQRVLTRSLAENGYISEALSTGQPLEAKGLTVGELQERWQFPSDHLPIGMTYENDHFLSWNVLDNHHMKWITTKNTMGLSHSLIAQENVYDEEGSYLTVRDKHVANLVCETLDHPTHPRSVLCLQECSRFFIQLLREKLPPHFEIYSYDGNAILIDKRKYQVIDFPAAKVEFGIFRDSPSITFQNLYLKRLEDDKMVRIINAHIPGNPKKPSRFEFAEYLKGTFDPSYTTIVMGDMNFNEIEMAEALSWVFEDKSPFSLYAPYCTNISPYTLVSKAIDQFFVYSPEESSVELNLPNEVMHGLDDSVKLLK